MEEKKRNEQRETVNHMQSLVGALCEVMTVENHLVCIGRLSHADNRELTLVPATARELPPVIYNTRFKLRIYRLADAPLEMEGSICANGPTKWQFDRLVDLNLMEKRRTFLTGQKRRSRGNRPHCPNPKWAWCWISAWAACSCGAAPPFSKATGSRCSRCAWSQRAKHSTFCVKCAGPGTGLSGMTGFMAACLPRR